MGCRVGGADRHVTIAVVTTPADDRIGSRTGAGLAATLLADARTAAASRGERHEFGSALDAAYQMTRLAVVSDAFLGQALWRVAAALRRRRVPVLPVFLRRLAIASAAIYIDDRAVVSPGVYIAHGQVVVEGPAVIHTGVVLFPGVTVAALDDGEGAPVIGRYVRLGSGSRVLGSIEIGARAQIGAGSVVLEDVPAGATAVGLPARIVGGDRRG